MPQDNDSNLVASNTKLYGQVQSQGTFLLYWFDWIYFDCNLLIKQACMQKLQVFQIQQLRAIYPHDKPNQDTLIRSKPTSLVSFHASRTS